MNPSKLSPLFLLLLLSACAQAPQRSVQKVEAQQLQPPVKAADTASLPKQELSDVMLYQFLLGDIAQQRGRPELAAQAYAELAKNTRDPRVAKRAAQLAIESRQFDKALEALALWQELEPTTLAASQMQVSLLLSGGRLEEAAPHVRDLLKVDAANAGRIFLQVHALLQRTPDKRAALDWLLRLVRDFPNVAEGHWAASQLAAELNDADLARAEAHEAVRLRPDWDLAAVFEAQLWLPKDAPKGLALLKGYVESYPSSRDARLYYARALLEQKRYSESREQFQTLLKDSPGNTEVAFAIALLSLQLGELDRAERELEQTLVKGNKDAGTVHYYLAQLHEARKDEAAAIEHYRKVQSGDYVYAARLREGQLLAKAGKLEEARDALHRAPAIQRQQRINLIVLEGQMLRDAKQYEELFKVLSDGLEKFPNQPQFLFETALAADKLGKTELFEQLLRKLLTIAPDTAHAYNALGYSFLERNVNVAEGMQLVEKAYQLAPNDPAITDSVGWGHYRLGNLEKSLEYLRRAYALEPDPEIAAHLGEVLWLQGSKEEALQVLQAAAKAHPDNQSVQALLKKYAP